MNRVFEFSRRMGNWVNPVNFHEEILGLFCISAKRITEGRISVSFWGPSSEKNKRHFQFSAKAGFSFMNKGRLLHFRGAFVRNPVRKRTGFSRFSQAPPQIFAKNRNPFEKLHLDFRQILTDFSEIGAGFFRLICAA